MTRATAPLARTGWMPHVVAPPRLRAGIGAKPLPACRDDRSSCNVVAGLLARPENNFGILIVAERACRSSISAFRDATGAVVEFDLGDLAQTAVAVFRFHPHINNVLTHICGGQWERIGEALRIILNPLATLNDLSPLAQNIVELMCADRGVTGRILRPHFHALLAKVLPPRVAAYLRAHVLRLFHEMKARDAHLGQGTVELHNRVAMQGAA